MNTIQRAYDILTMEAQAIKNVVLCNTFEDAVNTILECQGQVITTGMGKAGHVARKIAGTLCSTGTRSSYLHPGEASHGDSGIIYHQDIILAFSTSGKTREVAETIILAKNLGVEHVIAITSHPKSEVRILADIVVDMGIIQEPCPLDLTPSASTTVMMALGDALALCVMEKRKFSKEDFGKLHHKGYLGEKARS